MNKIDNNPAHVGGMQRKIERVSLHSIETGKRFTQNAKLLDLSVLTTISWRAQFLPALTDEVSLRRIHQRRCVT